MSPEERARVRALWAARGVAIADEELAGYAAARDPSDHGRSTEDLALACACARGDARAIGIFEDRYLPPTRRMLARAGVPDAVAEEVVSNLCARLFAALDRESPLITDYTGRGQLGAWTRSVALHAALSQLRRERRHVPFEDTGADVPLADPELVYMRELYASSLGDVLVAAFAALTRDERAILRQYYRHGLTIDDLGRLLGVHRVTAARRIKYAREALVREVRARVHRQLGASDPSLDSVLRLVGSRLAVEGLLRTTR